MAWSDKARQASAAARKRKATNHALAVSGQSHIKSAIATAKKLFGNSNHPLVVAKRNKYVRQAANQLTMASSRRMGKTTYAGRRK